MSRSFPGFDSPGAGFDEPFEMLAACHERIEAQLRILDRLGDHLATRGADAQAQSAAHRVLRYFDEAGPKHHADEEADLFPALEAAGELGDLLQILRQQHRAMEQAYAQLRPALESIAAAAGADWPREDAAHFCSLYRRHIAQENTELLPQAEKLLTPERKSALGKAMAARRGG